MYQIHESDVIKWAAAYSGPFFHALICDPPYHLTSIVKRFGKPGSAPAKHGRDGAFARQSRGFMGKQWDGGDLAFQPGTWAALAEHLHPGAFGMAFAAARGWHRMAVAIEDAGLTIHPSMFMLGWAQAQGLGKSVKVRNRGNLVSEFDGYRYGQQALRPSLEPIILFQKPYEGRPVDCIRKSGAGVLNFRDTRIALDESAERTSGKNATVYGADNRQNVHGSKKGREPKNLIMNHLPDCTPDRCADGCPVARMDDQAGNLKSGTGAAHNASAKGGDQLNQVYGAESRPAGTPCITYGDEGAASRFFFNSDYVFERMEEEMPVYYTGKASTWEREAGLDNFEYQTVGDGRKKPIDNAYQRGKTQRKNLHPTIKPLSLTHWLASLLLPPDAYAPRRLLVPFSGSGSEMIGAQLAGWDDIIGIEADPQYVAIAESRLRFWSGFNGQSFSDIEAQARAYDAAKRNAAEEQQEAEDNGQLTLWG